MCGWREGGKAAEGGKGKGPGLLVRKGGGKGKGGRETLVNLASRAADAAMLSVVMAIGLGRSGWGLRGSCSIIFSSKSGLLVPSSDSHLASIFTPTTCKRVFLSAGEFDQLIKCRLRLLFSSPLVFQGRCPRSTPSTPTAYTREHLQPDIKANGR